ncbi:hypothetical protein TRAPUB_11746 [Trametes pubescens]|uniref:Uncharacterized protein n=1 Tax=Trametes pubescens TaxID=154538 RepID=A0A1M2VVU8_TRAPU|nr:hypothetical protein TRAPUB_11746 [Trametes pubescens]
METLILDLGTTVTILAAVLAIIPFPNVFAGWFCKLVPTMRSPGPPRAWATSMPRSRPRAACSAATDPIGTPPTPSPWTGVRTGRERDANTLEVLAKGSGWGRYSVAHLQCCGWRVRRLDRKLDAVTKKLHFGDQCTDRPVIGLLQTRLDAALNPPSKPDEASTN